MVVTGPLQNPDQDHKSLPSSSRAQPELRPIVYEFRTASLLYDCFRWIYVTFPFPKIVYQHQWSVGSTHTWTRRTINTRPTKWLHFIPCTARGKWFHCIPGAPYAWPINCERRDPDTKLAKRMFTAPKSDDVFRRCLASFGFVIVALLFYLHTYLTYLHTFATSSEYFSHLVHYFVSALL